jgi:hypothetical protein
MRLPPQCPPVERTAVTKQYVISDSGVIMAQSQCDSLDGVARQLCYLFEYGVLT